jgi:uncharacterized protein (DUF58 family)
VKNQILCGENVTNYQLDSIDTLNSRQFTIAIKRLADTLMYGTDASPFVGSGIEYVQSRLYQSGDDVKSIDWRVTARTTKYHVKEFESPKQLSVYLLVDTSASMTIGSTKKTKYALAVYIAGGLAFAALDRISPVALVGVGERDIRYKPSLSRDKIMQWLHRLRTFRVDEATTLDQKIGELQPSLANRSLMIVLSDLNQPNAVSPLKKIAQQHDCIAIQLIDPAERGVKGSGFVRGREAETGAKFVTRRGKVGIDQAELANELKRGRVDHLALRTDQPIDFQLRHFFKSRGLFGSGAKS